MPDLPMMPVGELLPDLPDRNNPGLTRAENCVPAANAYGPVRDLVPEYDPLPERCRGASSVVDFSGNAETFAGTNTELYRLSGLTFNAVGGNGTPNQYDLNKEHFWTFFIFNNTFFAVGGYETLQEFGTSVFDDATVSTSGPVSDPPPQALYADVVRDFIVTGNQLGNEHELAWSALGRSDIWLGATLSSTDAQQAGRQTLQQGGAITGVVGGEYGIIFCEHAIYRMNYIGAPIVFSFDNVAPDRGTLAPGSIASVGHMIYYLDIDGFYVFNGSATQSIGSNKFNESFLEDINHEHIKSMDSIVDLENTRVYWSYVSKDSTLGTDVPNKMVCYDWVTNRFSGPIHIPTETLIYSLTPALLIDPDNAPPGNALIDGGPYSDQKIDSALFRGGKRPSISAFNTDHEQSTFTGETLTAMIETGEISFNPGGFAHLQGIRPVVDGADPEVTVGVRARNLTHGSFRDAGPIAPNARTQIAPFRLNMRYHRAQLNVGGDFEKIIGIEPVLRGSSKR